MNDLTTRDFATAGVPAAASLTLSQLNSLIGMAGGLLGIAYLIWKWKREAKK